MIDLLLLLMAVIWGTNYSIVKSAFQELDPAAFNAARMVIASAAFLGVIALAAGKPPGAALRRTGIDSIFRTATRLTVRDGLELVALGLVGHFLYQYFFIGGLALTTVANSSLMLATTPVRDRADRCRISVRSASARATGRERRFPFSASTSSSAAAWTSPGRASRAT